MKQLGGGTCDDTQKHPCQEDRVRPPIVWGWWPLSPPATSRNGGGGGGGVSGTDVGAERENRLMHKLPDRHKSMENRKTVYLIILLLLTDDRTGGSLTKA